MKARPDDASQETILTGIRVVVVEDEGITQMQLRMILVKAGLDYIGAAMNGEEGVDLVLRERPDLVLMDIKMPGAINGIEASKRILAEYRTCIVMLTAYIDYEEEARALGSCGYIVKPINSETLLPQLREAFRKFKEVR